ncbi:MAG: hypothetical protein V7724_18325 [Sediminicola sp.]
MDKKNFMRGKYWIIGLIILFCGYRVYKGLSDRNKWTAESREIMIERCMADSKEMGKKYPQLTLEYCTCSTDKIQAAFTHREYLKILEKSTEAQTRKLLPMFKICLNEYQERISKQK